MTSRIRNTLLTLAALAAMALGAGAIAQAGDNQAAPAAAPAAASQEAPEASEGPNSSDANEAESGSQAADGSDAGDSNKAITGSALDRASKVALGETGGGKVTETEEGDEESYYQVEVTMPNGDQTDVNLDKGFNVVHTTTEGPENPND
ncbi:MAG: hypothetical protein QOG62_1479 [Thermoleophilaceae bacterium]|nr:hypothetical protein [Thermoleophilaceae bacterium]